MRSIGSVFVVFVCLLMIVGCRPEERAVTGPKPPPQQPQVSSEQQQLLQEILEYTKQTGSTLDELAEEARRREALEQAPRGTGAIDEDLRVAKALVTAARSAASSQKAEGAAAALGRLAPALTALRAEVPAAAIAQHLERALVAISNLPAQEAANAASGSLLAAIDTAMQAPAPLVPEVVQAVEQAKSSVDSEQLSRASEQIMTVLKQLRDDSTVETTDSLLAGGRGAQEALARQAWPVLIAELDQLEAMLSRLQEKVGVTTTITEEAPAEEEIAEGTEAVGPEEEAQEATEAEERTEEVESEMGAEAETVIPQPAGPRYRQRGQSSQ